MPVPTWTNKIQHAELIQCRFEVCYLCIFMLVASPIADDSLFFVVCHVRRLYMKLYLWFFPQLSQSISHETNGLKCWPARRGGWHFQLLVGGLEHGFYFSIILGIITSTDFIFFRGVGIPPTRYNWMHLTLQIIMILGEETMGKPTFPHGSGEVPDAVMRNTVINALGRSRQVMKAVNQWTNQYWVKVTLYVT